MESISKKQIRQELERVKFSVQQFGLQAYNPTERRKLERDRLIRLGAKAPKKEWKNYKGLKRDSRTTASRSEDRVRIYFQFQCSIFRIDVREEARS